MSDDFQQLRAKLDRLKRDALVAAERKALRSTGEVIREELMTLAPEQAGKAEGLLAVGELKASFRSYVRIARDDKAASGTEDTVVVMPNTKVTRDVLGWLERGHAGRTKDANRTNPRPFVRAAQDAVETKAVDTYREVMTSEIKKAFNE
ncbi:HK97-gp10 family putative phage morphogenesis protein [Granulicella cerasi]|uniref:HK97-gp10 family putative phage morphogenesis protein n=1 Tax=Granulicella cerasi TaxID=741063 RepID=A0ABW1Z7L2_9BACT|nr:HK97-gp10 family putative phage morphogenesis protein [Granulicella cerasi]